jgi:hypothetical protein
MKKSALLHLFAAIAAVFAVSVSTPALLRADGPIYWVVKCTVGDHEVGLQVTTADQIPDAIAACGEIGGEFAGVEPAHKKAGQGPDDPEGPAEPAGYAAD